MFYSSVLVMNFDLIVFELFDGAILVFYPNRFQGCFIILLVIKMNKNRYILEFENKLIDNSMNIFLQKTKQINNKNQISLSLDEMNSSFVVCTSLVHAILSSMLDLFLTEDF